MFLVLLFKPIQISFMCKLKVTVNIEHIFIDKKCCVMLNTVFEFLQFKGKNCSYFVKQFYLKLKFKVFYLKQSRSLDFRMP